MRSVHLKAAMAAAACSVLCGLVIGPGLAASAGASTSGPTSSVPATIAGAATSATSPTAPAPSSSVSPQGAPTCNVYDFCSYNRTNGGTLCFFTTHTQNYPANCSTEGKSAYNRWAGYARLHYLGTEGGAYYQLPETGYLLYMTENTFNHCATSTAADRCDGLGTTLYDNVASVKLQTL